MGRGMITERGHLLHEGDRRPRVNETLVKRTRNKPSTRMCVCVLADVIRFEWVRGSVA